MTGKSIFRMLIKQSAQVGTNNVILGTFAIFLELCILMAISSIVKTVSSEVSISVILLFRFWFCLPFLFAIGLYQHGIGVFHVSDVQSLILRSVFGFIGLTTMFIALSLVDITKVVALGQTSAVFITLLAPLILGESVGMRRWIAVLIGMCGVLIVLQPGTEGWFAPGILFALASPFFAALMFIFLRKIGLSDTPATSSIVYNCFGTLVISIWCLTSAVDLPSSPTIWVILAIGGVLSTFQQILMATAHALAPASTLAPMRYFAVPISIAIGIVLFQEEITWNFLLGTLVIILSTHYIVIRQRLRERMGEKDH